jgi:hypothetical protein
MGFNGMRRVVARFNFSCNLTETHPQPLNVHIVKHVQAKKKYKNNEKNSIY